MPGMTSKDRLFFATVFGVALVALAAPTPAPLDQPADSSASLVPRMDNGESSWGSTSSSDPRRPRRSGSSYSPGDSDSLFDRPVRHGEMPTADGDASTHYIVPSDQSSRHWPSSSDGSWTANTYHSAQSQMSGDSSYGTPASWHTNSQHSHSSYPSSYSSNSGPPTDYYSAQSHLSSGGHSSGGYSSGGYHPSGSSHSSHRTYDSNRADDGHEDIERPSSTDAVTGHGYLPHGYGHGHLQQQGPYPQQGPHPQQGPYAPHHQSSLPPSLHPTQQQAYYPHHQNSLPVYPHQHQHEQVNPYHQYPSTSQHQQHPQYPPSTSQHQQHPYYGHPSSGGHQRRSLPEGSLGARGAALGTIDELD